MVPPAGTYYMTIMLIEYDSNGTEVVTDYTALDPATATFVGVAADGAISGTLRIPEGYVLDGDTANPDDPVVENNAQGQRVPVPSTILGFASNTYQITDEFDFYRVYLQGSIGISLSIAEPDAGDLDLYLVGTDASGELEIIQDSVGTGRYETLQTQPGLRGEFLVVVRAKDSRQNRSLISVLGTPYSSTPHGTYRVR